MGDREAFERELEDYISERRNSSFFRRMFKRKPKVRASLSPEIKTYGGPEGPKEMEKKQEAELTEEYTPKKGFFGRLFGSADYEAVEKKPEPSQEAVADMKEVARIALNVLKQLPQEQLAEYKQSQEFSRLKELLKKYNLIK